MSDATANRCSVERGEVVHPCASLSSALECDNPTGKRKGVWCWHYVDIKGDWDKPSRQFFGVKSGEHVEKGFAFNFCPWCGVDISAPFKKGASDE